MRLVLPTPPVLRRRLARGVALVRTVDPGGECRRGVAASGIAADVRTGLTDKLDAVSASLSAGQTATATATACNQLDAFTSQAQRGKAIPAGTADLWVAQVAQTRRALGC